MSAAAVSEAEPNAKARAPRVPKPAPSHPTYAAMVAEAIAQLNERSGSSKAAIFKYITQRYQLGDNVKMINLHLKKALSRGVTKRELQRVSGVGAAGSFKLVVAKKNSKQVITPLEKKPIPKKTTDKKKVPKATLKPSIKEKMQNEALGNVDKALKIERKEAAVPKKGKKKANAVKKHVITKE